MNKDLFDDLKSSLKEAIEYAEGKKELQTKTLPRPPKELNMKFEKNIYRKDKVL